MKTIHVGIIGLNRRTASIGLALHAHNNKPKSEMIFEIIGQDADKASMKQALEMGAIDRIESDTRNVATRSNMIILDLPVGVHEEVMHHFAPKLKAGCVILDMSTMKQPVIETARESFPTNAQGKAQAYLVGIQPLVGQEAIFDTRDDVGMASDALFENAEMIIAPDVRCPEEAVKLASDLTGILGMRTRYLSPEEYDALAEFTERLPLLLSFALFASMRHTDLLRTVNPRLGSMLQNLVGVEASDLLALWRGNPQTSRARIDEIIRILNDLKALIDAEYDDELRDYVGGTIRAFQDWDIRRTMGKWAEDEDAVKAPSLGSSFSGLFGGFGSGRRDDDKR